MGLPSPVSGLRREYFCRALAAEPQLLADSLVGKLASATASLSFAHLCEVTQAAGLAAIRAGREERTQADLMEAADTMARAHRAAGHGFPASTEEPFGLAQFRAGRGEGGWESG